MKIFHLLLFAIAFQMLSAQTFSSEQISVIFSIQNDLNEPLAKQEVIVQNAAETLRAFTKSSGV